MTTTPQSQALQDANAYIAIAQQLMSIYTQATPLAQQWTDHTTATILAALPTAALNTDGSTGAADSTPNAAHPITSPGLSRAVSSTQITQMKSIIDGFLTYINGLAVTTQPGARAILNVAVGG